MVLQLLFYAILTCLISLFIGFVVVAIFYHSIFKPNYIPGKTNLPFIWYPFVKSIYWNSKKKLAVTTHYTIEALSGMCVLFDKQGLFSFDVFGKKYVMLFKANTAEVVLSSTKLLQKNFHYETMRPMLKDGLIMSNGEKWYKRRKLLTSTFHFKILQDFVPRMRETAIRMLPRLEPPPGQSWVDIMDVMKRTSLDVFMQTAMGVEVDQTSEETVECFAAIKKFSLYDSMRSTRPWLEPFYRFSSLKRKTDECCKTVHSYILKVIANKKKKALEVRQKKIETEKPINGKVETENSIGHFKKNPKAFMDLCLDLHLEDGSLTEEDIMEETLSFFTGVTNAEVNALANSIYCIGLYKEEQKKIHDELDTIFGNSDRDITEDDVKSMKYLECVIKEAMRLYPHPFVGRVATENFKINDYTISKGTIVSIVTYMIHRDPEIYSDPEKFDPTRFFPENSKGRPSFAYIPFSAGPRNCIAQRFALLQMKIVAATILRKFNAHSLDQRDIVNRVSATFPLRMSFTPRNASECE